MKTGIELIAEERQRQIEVEGWSAKHDANHIDGSLAKAAACYAMPNEERENYQNLPVLQFGASFPYWWPKSWALDWWKPSPENRIHELQKAGALIAAEIDRLQFQKFECTSCSKSLNTEEMESDSGDNHFCKECFAELKPVMDADYKEMVEKGEIEV